MMTSETLDQKEDPKDPKDPKDDVMERVTWSFVLLTIVLGSYALNKIETLVTCFCLIAVLEWTNIADRMQRLHDTSESIHFLGTMILTLFWISSLNLYSLEPILFFECILLVCISDISAYFFGGQTLNATKLWPSISPNKTLGGSIASLVCCTLLGLLLKSGPVLCLGLSFIAQGGDLIESFVKRKAQLKDSNLTFLKIPGHGGILDRIDGMVFSMPVAYALHFLNIQNEKNTF